MNAQTLAVAFRRSYYVELLKHQLVATNYRFFMIGMELQVS